MRSNKKITQNPQYMNILTLENWEIDESILLHLRHNAETFTIISVTQQIYISHVPLPSHPIVTLMYLTTHWLATIHLASKTQSSKLNVTRFWYVKLFSCYNMPFSHDSKKACTNTLWEKSSYWYSIQLKWFFYFMGSVLTDLFIRDE